jgi:hypothetical protein
LAGPSAEAGSSIDVDGVSMKGPFEKIVGAEMWVVSNDIVVRVLVPLLLLEQLRRM